MKMVNKMLSLKKEIVQHISTNDQISNFSRWVEKKYSEEFMKQNLIYGNILKAKDDIKKWELELKKLEEQESSYTHIYEDLKVWLKNEGMQRIARHGIENVYRQYSTEIKNVSFDDFHKAVKRMKKELNIR